MLYRLLKFPAQIALRLYVKHLHISHHDVLKTKGPLLIACNHPNSFLDAIILATLFEQPVISLARGDAFKNKFIFWVLRSLHILPIYRLSEGAQNLHVNYSTFDSCRQVFRNNGIVLIFSEGLCINEWKLRPLKKGTARLALSCWQEGIPLTILPAGINYHSFTSFGKIVKLHFGNPIQKADLPNTESEGASINFFNEKLNQAMLPLIEQINDNDTQTKEKVFNAASTTTGNNWLMLPAVTGKILHAPLYLPLRFLARKFFLNSGHYDSLITGLLILLYPLYLMLVWLSIYYGCGALSATIISGLIPVLAYCYIHWKRPVY